jgi:hypothetical protein
MRRRKISSLPTFLVVLALLPLAGCRKKGEEPLAPEANPPGVIPAGQAFAAYESAAGGYGLEAPEGWERVEDGPAVTFSDGPDGVAVAIRESPTPPTASSARSLEANQIEKSARAAEILSVEDVTLPAGPAVVIRYTTNSDPDPTTGKQLRIENRTILFHANGRLAGLTLWSPQGADNEGHWDRVAKSFRWL